jgi:hypothetical protein
MIIESNEANQSPDRERHLSSEGGNSSNNIALSPISMKKVRTTKAAISKPIIIQPQIRDSCSSIFEVKEKQKYSLLHMTNSLYGGAMEKQETL